MIYYLYMSALERRENIIAPQEVHTWHCSCGMSAIPISMQKCPRATDDDDKHKRIAHPELQHLPQRDTSKNPVIPAKIEKEPEVKTPVTAEIREEEKPSVLAVKKEEEPGYAAPAVRPQGNRPWKPLAAHCWDDAVGRFALRQIDDKKTYMALWNAGKFKHQVEKTPKPDYLPLPGELL